MDKHFDMKEKEIKHIKWAMFFYTEKTLCKYHNFKFNTMPIKILAKPFYKLNIDNSKLL